MTGVLYRLARLPAGVHLNPGRGAPGLSVRRAGHDTYKENNR